MPIFNAVLLSQSITHVFFGLLPCAQRFLQIFRVFIYYVVDVLYCIQIIYVFAFRYIKSNSF